MCGRFASSLPADEMRRLFQIMGELPNVEPSWNIAPSQRAAVVRRHPETGERRLDLLTWGLVPSFTKNLKAARKPINARSETVATSGMFRQALAKRRAIVPADLFYEWRAQADGKQPFAIGRTDGQPVGSAALWEGWKSPDGEILRTFTILTTEANAEMRAVHDLICTNAVKLFYPRGQWQRKQKFASGSKTVSAAEFDLERDLAYSRRDI